MHSMFSRQWVAWLSLLVLSLLSGGFLKSAGFPAAFLVGSMLCGIVLTVTGVELTLPRRLFQCAQALIGCTVASCITADILLTVYSDWAAMLLVVGSVVIAGGLVGWMLVRSHILPGTTAAWGSTPGAASAMVAMAEAYGADARLVALMQYLRVLVVELTASMVSHFLLSPGQSAVVSSPAASFALEGNDFRVLMSSLGVALIGGFVGVRLRIAAGAMLVPMLLGSVLHSSELVDIHVPFWVPAGASIILGWYVGLGFSRRLLVSAFRMLPRLLVSTVLLISLCGFAAWMMAVFMHTDPLTAYLATSPGGLDSVILIALGSHADVPFVVAVQTMRLFAVILLGPWIARLICRNA